MLETTVSIVLAIFVVLFFGAIVVVPIVRAPHTKNPQFTRGLGIFVLGGEILLVCGLAEAPTLAMLVGVGVLLVGFVLAAAS